MLPGGGSPDIGTQTTARTGKLPSYRAIFGFIFALGLVSFVVRIWWPAGWIFQLLNVPVGYLPQYISLYILGLIAYRRNWFLQLSSRMAKEVALKLSSLPSWFLR